MTLARTSLDTQARDFGTQLAAGAATLATVPETLAAVPLETLRANLGAQDMNLWSASGRLLASTGQSRYELSPERPSAQVLRNLRAQGTVTQIEGLDDVPDAQASSTAQVRAWVMLNSRSLDLRGEQRIVQAVQPLPTALVSNALAVQAAYQEYQERALGRDGLRRMYIGTLTLSLFLAVFGAVLLAVVLGKQLVKPLLMLADGMRQVAAGDLTPKVTLDGRDELGGLTRSFAEMTRQLADAQMAVQSSMHEVDAARANLQTILDNLTAGVIVLDQQGQVLNANPGATRVLRQPLAAYVGKRLQDLPQLQAFGDEVAARFSQFEHEQLGHDLENWQQSFELYGQGGESASANAVSVIARGAVLPQQRRLLVLDDISEIVSAQRSQAWGEVARRLAHEIKNPLTPIQLSAERLERRLGDKLEAADQALLNKAVRTIVDQVDAMKHLVNEFRDYARLPAARLQPVDLNEVVAEVMQLYVHASESGDAAVPVRFECDTQVPPIMGDAQQLRQVIHNLVQNAVDAVSSDTSDPSRPAEVLVRTQWLEGSDKVRLSVQDSGQGFPGTILKRAFEPYVTTKPKGTGLGLAVVKKIADDHNARIDLLNRIADGQVIGAQVSLSFPIAVDSAPAAAS